MADEILNKISRIGMWAPGSYMCTCFDCEDQFTGDKRALQCLPCAIKSEQGYAARLEAELKEAGEIIDAFYTQVSTEGTKHFPHALTTRARAFLRDNDNG